MELKDFFEANPILNKSQMAREMFPNVKSPKTKLANKLAKNIVGTGKQRITKKDKELAKKVLKNLADNISVFIDNSEF